jgi:hypothetical protein
MTMASKNTKKETIMNSKNAEPLLKRRGLLAALCTLGATESIILKTEESTAHAATQKSTSPKKSAAWMQNNWHWCNKCQGLFFAGHGAGICPAGGAHNANGSGNYGLLADYP